MGVVDKNPNKNSINSQTKEIDTPKENDSKKDQQELLKKAQELQRSIQNGIFEAE